VNRRALGRTGLAVSEIGFGCGPTAGLMVDGPPDRQRAVVSRALELGVDYFDTAPTYGDGASERNLGRHLRELGAVPAVATKVALTVADLDDIATTVERSVEASLARLGLPSVPIVQLHNRVGRERAPKAPFGTGALLTIDDVLGPGGVVDGFRRLRDRGLARWFGCSAFGGDRPEVERLVDSGAFDVVTVHYSLANPTAWRPAPDATPDYGGIGARAAAAGMGVIGLRVLEGGRLAGDAGAALRFALGNPDLSCVIVGFSDLGQVEQAADVSYSL
jgi:aryl-alcohol dehydrogenase-like predicted oxidoreductase